MTMALFTDINPILEEVCLPSTERARATEPRCLVLHRRHAAGRRRRS